MKRNIFVTTFILLLIPILFYVDLIKSKTNEGNAFVYTPQGNKVSDPIKVAKNYKVSTASEAEMQEILSQFEFESKNKTKQGTKLDTEVKFGESVLTSMFESKDGEYVAAKITPVLKGTTNGHVEINLSIEAFSMSTDGNYEDRITRTQVIQSGSGATIFAIDDQGSYIFTIQAKVNSSQSDVMLSIDGQYQEKKYVQ